MKTVGRHMFGIKYHWGQFEFASGHGQIHFHILAINEDQSVNKIFYDLRNDREAQAQFLAEWSSGCFGYTAEVDNELYENVNVTPVDNPCCEYYSKVINIVIDIA